MRLHSQFVLVIAIISFIAAASAQNATASPDSSSTMLTSPSNSTEDPVFTAFPPVTAGMKPPKATFVPDPKFPDLPADAEPRGTVVLLIGVNAKGRVGPVRVLRSDETAFEKSAVETVRKWKFKPAQKDGHPVPVQVTVEMKFQR